MPEVVLFEVVMWQVHPLTGQSASVTRLEFNDDGVQVISGSDDDTVRGALLEAQSRLNVLVIIICSRHDTGA